MSQIPRGELDHYHAAVEAELEADAEVLSGPKVPDEVMAAYRRDLMEKQRLCQQLLGAAPEAWAMLESQAIHGIHLEELMLGGSQPTFQDIAIAKAAQAALLQWVRFMAKLVIPTEEQGNG